MEIILVLAIIALLIGMGTAMMKGVFGDAQEANAKADVRALESSVMRYRTKSGVFPTTAQGLDALVTRPTTSPQPRSWKQLIKRQEDLLDPWQNPYKYRFPGTINTDSYDIYSLGPDGAEGTEDDIGNW